MQTNIWNLGWDAALHSAAFKRFLVRHWYEFFSSLDRDGMVPFMNFGYADDAALRLALNPIDELQRYPLQMYHHVATQIDVRELDILEVGSGRGGGASYVMRYLRPRTYTGIDITQRAVAFCRTRYRLPGLNFFQGDAEQMQFPDATFDAVLNIESSTHYGNIEKFFSEVRRVLRPGGFFLYADTWYPHEFLVLQQQFAAAGLMLVGEHDMMRGVVRALELDEPRKIALNEKYAPKFLHGAMREFGGMVGSAKYETFRSGKVIYVCCLLTKEGQVGGALREYVVENPNKFVAARAE